MILRSSSRWRESPRGQGVKLSSLYLAASVRGFHPRQWIGGPTFEQVHADFFAKLDAVVFGRFSHFKSLHNDAVYKSLSLYVRRHGRHLQLLYERAIIRRHTGRSIQTHPSPLPLPSEGRGCPWGG